MDLELAKMYSTPGVEQASQEDLEKKAEAELFCKLAAENGIDLNAMDDTQVAELYESTFKTAQEEEKKKKDDDEEEDEKAAAAHAEFAAVQGAQEKVAEADYLGRVMAHAFTQESAAIQGAMDKEAKVPSMLRRAATRGEELLKGTRLGKTRAGSEAAKPTLKALRGGAEPTTKDLSRLGVKSKDELSQAARGAVGSHRKELAKVYGARAGAGLGAAAAGYGAAKTSSAIDELAAQAAVEKIAEAGWDLDEGVERLTAVLTLGVGESTKIAHATNTEEAVDIRSLELLETAGYPVGWE